MSWKDETTELRWFRNMNFNCRQCGKRAAGELMGTRNQSYGLHCQKCAERRLKDSQKARDEEAENV